MINRTESTHLKSSSRLSEKTKELTKKLYNYGNEVRMQHKKASNSEDSRRKQQFNAVHVGQNSNSLFDNMKNEKFHKIFNLLDSDEDGKISFTCMETKRLPTNVRQLLDPVFRQIKLEKDSLNRTEFVKILHRIYDVCS